MYKKILLFTLISSLFASFLYASEAAPTIAKSCTACHQAVPNAVRGIFDNVAFKSKTIQLKLDDVYVLLNFDEDDIKVVNAEGKSGDGEFLKNNKMKGKAVKVEFSEKNGVKTALKLTEKAPVKLDADMLISGEELEKLITTGAKKSAYYLFDSRPLSKFQEGFIPTAVNLPFNSFSKDAPAILPADKKALIIFYCAGPTCQMSPGSAKLAQKLGYSNVKVYKDGIPGWQSKHYGALSAESLKKGWFDKDIPAVILDVRSGKNLKDGHIKGAVSFPAKQSAKLIKKLELKKNVPIIVYDQTGSKEAQQAASNLIKSGYSNVLILESGFAGWKNAKQEIVKGKLSEKVSYIAKLKQGEINLDEFKKYVETPPENVMIIDVRNDAEVKKSSKFKTSVVIPAENIKERVSEIDKNKLVITHCATGVRAEMAYHELVNLGFKNVKFVNAKIDFEHDGSYKITKE